MEVTLEISQFFHHFLVLIADCPYLPALQGLGRLWGILRCALERGSIIREEKGDGWFGWVFAAEGEHFEELRAAKLGFLRCLHAIKQLFASPSAALEHRRKKYPRRDAAGGLGNGDDGHFVAFLRKNRGVREWLFANFKRRV